MAVSPSNLCKGKQIGIDDRGYCNKRKWTDTGKEHTGTSTGTKYNDKKTKKADYTLKHYRVYQQNIATGVKHLKYKLTEWSWTGYKKQNGKWVYDTKKSGSNREHLDPMSLLNGYLFP